jgi:hypothetical protein
MLAQRSPVQFSPQQFKFAVPSHLEFRRLEHAKLFAQAILKLRRVGGTPVEIDFAPFVGKPAPCSTGRGSPSAPRTSGRTSTRCCRW